MISYPPLTLTANQTSTLTIGAVGSANIVLANDSPFTVQVTFEGSGHNAWLLSGEVNSFDLSNFIGFSGNITMLASVVLPNAAQAPQFSVLATVYGTNEMPDNRSYPMFLSRVSNIGNQVTTNVGGSNTLQNDNNAAASQFIEATETGSPGSNWLGLNDGTLKLSEWYLSTLTTLLQVLPGAPTPIKLAAIGRLVEVLGDLKVDGTTTTNAINTGAATIFGLLEAKAGLQSDTTTTLTGAVTATNASNNILASSVPATGVSAGALPAGVTLAGTQLTGTIHAPGDLEVINTLKLNTTGATYDAIYGDTATGLIFFQVPQGTNAWKLGVGSLIAANGRIMLGNSVAGDVMDSNGSLFLKATAGNGLVFQSPSGTSKWSRKAETFGTTAAAASTSTVVTHNLTVNGVGVTPDVVLCTPFNSGSNTATWTIVSKSSTSFTIFNFGSFVQTFDWMCYKF